MHTEQDLIAEKLENLLVEAGVWHSVVRLYPSQNQPGVWQIEAHGSASKIRDKLQQHDVFLVTDAVQDYVGDDKYALVRFRLKAKDIDAQYADTSQLANWRQARGVLAPANEPAEVAIRSLRDGDAAINGLEAELTNLRRQYSEQSAELASTQEERDLLLRVLTNLHTMLNKAGMPYEGNLTERVQAVVGRMQNAERRHRRAVQNALMFRCRWLAACKELDSEAENQKPSHKIVEWLRAVKLYPTDVFETSDPYTIYASFDEPISGAALRVLGGLNLRVKVTPIHNRYMVQFVPSRDDEV